MYKIKLFSLYFFLFRCKNLKYSPNLKASIIVIFYNELMSVILRTVWSVILQTPSHLLEEIILVDDSSTDGILIIFYQTSNYHMNYIF